MFYWSKLYTEDLKAAENYSDLNRTIAINILGYNLFKEHQNFHSVYKIQNIETGELFTNLLEIQCIELPKFSKTKPDMNDPLHRWLLFLTEHEDQQNLMEVFKLDQLVSKADEKLRRLSADEEVIRTYQLREKYLLDLNTQVNGARNAGMNYKAIEIAKSLLKLPSMSVQDVATHTGLTLEKVKEIEKEVR
ncbi:Rpn family recombination-promoting nuclease/putative transposase [Metabacillus sp. FJAT-52054]|uniref:Rpn family recombination-promoting nuclease/putative transposase n=1 Tax=Metabacillus sediminis TaxID=3117746 RepID=A0ABZ2NJ05_9BACI